MEAGIPVVNHEPVSCDRWGCVTKLVHGPAHKSGEPCTVWNAAAAGFDGITVFLNLNLKIVGGTAGTVPGLAAQPLDLFG